MNRQRFLQLLLGLTAATSSQFLKGCRQTFSPQDNPELQRELKFGILTTKSEEELLPRWQPFLADLTEALGIPVKPFFALQYSSLIEAMRSGVIQIAWFGGKTYIEAATVADARAFALTVSDKGSRGYYAHLIARGDRLWLQAAQGESPSSYLLEQGKDLTFAFNDVNSTSGYLVPMYYLFSQNGIDPLTHFQEVSFLGNHEATALAIAEQKIDVATNNSEALQRFANRYPEEDKTIRIIWTSPFIPADPIAYDDKLPDDLKEKIRNFFYGYDDQAILQSLNWSGFDAATDADWHPIRELNIGKQILDIEQNESITLEEKAGIVRGLREKLQELQTTPNS
ncbi:phosphonate ABC transporter, periplasmic phosphonate binding protein [[Leptolyngbya] sp. PCC 7376]|uniref:phosphonate ABC transporter substrate-binding protein n=1 Tax=[Leptolyngbya] sp. PCC 7376 TaxID=111781 RepID=UPI00029EDAF4|nr:phosphonate ABC transporter substrate-binding protein [[Leptolyngbya] sp. PCC 7376]AFY37590.1 phosphonate ABC transporter, periplasmic phosphonate binding protein [[Leptolyngbya] sp. PCC 7376]